MTASRDRKTAAKTAGGRHLDGLTWAVYVDRFPLAGPGKRLGQVIAPNRTSATAAAVRLFGPRVIVGLAAHGHQEGR